MTVIFVNGNIFPVKIQNKFKTMKNKMGNLLNVKKGVGLFIDLNEVEFPRGNITLKNIHKEIWREYYDCLKKQYIEMGPNKTLHPSALTTMEGTSAEYIFIHIQYITLQSFTLHILIS